MDGTRFPSCPPDAHHAVDWARVKRSIRALRPVRSAGVVSVGLFGAVVWAERVAAPVAAARSVDTAFAIAFWVSMVCAIGMATGSRMRRWSSAVLLFAAVGGTLLAAPTRHLISAWIVGA
ncbi:hypothetical protein [Streptomyces sp. NBC_01264]|uniref:hypothetical protein n=1 Tax=Streptomyces sp. NBC_01264 TaxID=2903804 RepID=UPI00224FD8CB|nr:hypothetical protein [Streptomyces sp. NBC_01264]MCX4783323.1 hypothetical protein [Streptomyces sp. NBC_01264]